MSTTKKIALAAATGILVMLLAGLAAKARWDAQYYDGYDPTAALDAVLRANEDRPEYRRVDFTFDGLPGVPVPTLLALPKEGAGPFPCIVFLHGIGQQKSFLDEIAAVFVNEGFAIACSDQYTRGERRLEDAGWLEGALALRRRAALNVIETRRLVDYLQTRPDVAPNRIYLVGASFGAITGSTAVAFEPRIPAAVLTYGGGDLSALLSSQAARAELGALRWPVQALSAFLLAPSDPVNYVARIAPRPLLFQNGSHDSLIPTEAAYALYNAAAEPKKLTMYDSDHVGLDPVHVMTVLHEAIDWLKAIDRQRRDEGR